MIKAIFFDIDGTLVSFKTHQVPESAQESIRELHKKGIKVFIATGRHIQSIPDFGNLKFDGYITINGGLCLLENKIPIYKHPVSRSNVQAMIELQKTKPFPCLVMDNNGLYINFLNEDVGVAQELKLFPNLKIRPFTESLDTDIYQMVSFIPVEEEKNVLPFVPECDSLRWHPLFTDIVPKGSNKAIGIDKIIGHLGISLKETMAFGDGGNDIAMLEHAGTGVVMGNAADSVKAAADYVTDSVDEDGIYNALKHFGIL
ncbi:MAG: Cof-type HAD-IIB family hydrolase [Paludibacter sp.]